MKMLMFNIAVYVKDKRPLKSESGKNLLQRGRFLCFCFLRDRERWESSLSQEEKSCLVDVGPAALKVDLLFSINMICCFLSI